jgi:phenylalanyl-tRNA synthetase beta chain
VKFSLNWLKDYVALNSGADEIAHAITMLGLEVESVTSTGAPKLEQVFVGEVLTRAPHPNADRLSLCTVDVGPSGGVKTIVCGAQNFAPGDRVPVALPGAVLPGDFKIRQSKIRGQTSDGMMCAAEEIGLPPGGADGLLILSERPAIGTPINDALPPGDTVFDVEITPNRPDCLSHIGLARELAAWFRLELNYPRPNVAASGRQPAPAGTKLLEEVRVEASEDCPLYTAQAISGVRIGPSPAWLQQRLQSVGLRPINNVVDVTNFVMLETGQPLHAFDAARLSGKRIIVRHATEGEKIVTLDEKERRLYRTMLVIADGEKPQVIAGIMGGVDSGVGDSTTDLVLEGACFRRGSVRRTSRQIGLSSDSSYRFERGVDPHALPEAVARAIALIQETAGGVPAGPSFRVGADVPWQREIVLAADFVRERLGFEVPDADMKASLESLELGVSGGASGWTVSIPTWRTDLDRPIDLVEEILRLHGTDRIPPAAVIAPALVAEDAPAVRFNRGATDYLVGHDFHECLGYTLRSGREIGTWVSQAAAAELAIANPFIEDQSHLRPTLVLGLLEVLKLNQDRGVPAGRLFETGRVFVENNGRILECCGVGFVMAIPPGQEGWLAREPVDFFTAKHHVQSLAALAGIDLAASDLAAVTGPYWGWQEGQSAGTGRIEDGWTARFGLLNLAMVRGLGITGKVFAGMMTILPSALPAATERPRFRDLGHFPAATRDIALVLDEEVSAREATRTVQELAEAAASGSFALERVALFDRYVGPGLPAGKKSLAFSLAFRSAERTLTDDEVNAVLKKVQEGIASRKGYQVRG